jgi:hypothetical protein
MLHGAVGCLRSHVSYVFEKRYGKAALAVEEAVWSYALLGGAVTQPWQPLAAMSRSPDPESMAAGKSCGGVPICSIDQ